MSDTFDVWVDGVSVSVNPDVTVAGAIARAGVAGTRRSVRGQLRAPLCGMGICYECRATVNGEAHVKTCQRLCEPGMRIETDAAH